MPDTVLADAQFGNIRILRAYSGFESDYQGQPADTPIMVSEEGIPRDPLAERQEPGYDPNLIRGLTVPLGARVLIWIPSNILYAAGDPPESFPYKWVFWWRYRNLADFRRDRQITWHLPRQGLGVEDTTFPAGQRERTVIPAATQTVIYTQEEPTTPFTRVAQTARYEDINFGGFSIPNPLLPGGVPGAIQQGILDPAVIAGSTRPAWQIHEIQALGDELMIGIFRDTNLEANWNFELNDATLPIYLGSNTPRNVGVYVTVGSAP